MEELFKNPKKLKEKEKLLEQKNELLMEKEKQNQILLGRIKEKEDQFKKKEDQFKEIFAGFVKIIHKKMGNKPKQQESVKLANFKKKKKVAKKFC